jgi:hypothetical protein
MRDMKEGIQDFIKTIGDEGCYALTLCRVAEMFWTKETGARGEAVSNIEYGVLSGYIAGDMTVLDGAAFLGILTFREWNKEYKDSGYKPRKDDYLIAEWYNKRTGKTHFTLEYPEKWNSLSNSVTVNEGAIRSYRRYRVKGIKVKE